MSDALAIAVLSGTGSGIVAVAGTFGAFYRTRARLANDKREIEQARQRAIVELAAERERIGKVEAPAANADAWSAVFKVTHETMLALQADVARLEQRLNDQDHEHRIELQDRDRVAAERERALRNTSDSLRRLRSYVSVITQLLAQHDIPFPDPPADVDEIAPERRSLTAPPTTVTAIVTDTPHQEPRT